MPVLACCPMGATGGIHWLSTALRGHLGGTLGRLDRYGQADKQVVVSWRVGG
jgi:hypothetical protein